MLNAEEYRAALVSARDEWHCKNHPFFTSWAAGELTKDAMKAYVQQHYNFVSERVALLRDHLWAVPVVGRPELLPREPEGGGGPR